MNVHAIDSKHSHHISVQGSLQSQADRDEFFRLFGRGSFNEVELTFFDAHILPAEVMMAIRSFQVSFPGTKLRINVFHRYLRSSFYRLGIHCSIIQQHLPGYQDSKKIRAIALGGSAGSLDKIIAIMTRFRSCDISVFIVQHILENEPNYLGEILERQISFPVARVADNMPVRTNRVYIAPPGKHLVVEGGRIHLLRSRLPLNRLHGSTGRG